MLDDSLFVSDTIHEREVDIGGGKKVKLHFKELPATDFIRFRIAAASENVDARAGAAARVVSAGLVDPSGAPAITYERALRLKPVPLNAIFAVVMEVSSGSGGGGNALPSVESSGSGTF